MKVNDIVKIIKHRGKEEDHITIGKIGKIVQISEACAKYDKLYPREYAVRFIDDKGNFVHIDENGNLGRWGMRHGQFLDGDLEIYEK